MRVIGGELKGRKFHPPAKNWPTRPTTDFAKEGLYNILQNRIDWTETKMLDLFGGTGSQGYEAISRGCQDVTYVDQFKAAATFVKSTAEQFKIDDRLTVVQMEVAKFIKNHKLKYDYIFAGPPYPLKWLDKIPMMIFEQNLLSDDGLFVLEHNPHHDFTDYVHYKEQRKYGTTIFSFFQMTADNAK